MRMGEVVGVALACYKRSTGVILGAMVSGSGQLPAERGLAVTTGFDHAFEQAMDDLPREKELAFAEYVRRVEEIILGRGNVYGDRELMLKRSAVSHIEALDRSLELDLPISFRPTEIQLATYPLWFNQLMAQIKRFAVQYKVAHIRQRSAMWLQRLVSPPSTWRKSAVY
jgi:hypothetical protein